MKIKPLFDRVVIEQLEAKQQTQSGLFIPSSSQEKPQMARVIFVGEGGIIDGKEIKMYVKPGDVVFYSKFAGMEYHFKDKVYTIIRQADILGILEDEENE
ncbi:MAG: co-chaperone GroES [Firmicutes bacterium]|nr:co-chaperone GroES [Bacillota bacterium]MDY3659313.1 co-chaperone GroES [Eubacteriales bacterium]